jgi:acyl-CoA synthetase (AMP-forming)/AMP-acid ligase II
MAEIVNVAARLAAAATDRPEATAVIEPRGRDRDGRRSYAGYSFRELDDDSDSIAAGLRRMGVAKGTRLALLVRPGFDFISLVFALFKAGAVTILVDPGMGLRGVIDCLDQAEPEGFVALPPVHAVRCFLRHRFRRARFNLTVGRRWFWGGTTLARLRRRVASGPQLAATAADDPAAIIFTSGSTGPAKGVLYRHGNFDRQVSEIRDHYGIEPGGIDLACFPLFGLFNCAMGVTTVVPDMEASHPAAVDPANIVEAIHDCGVTQSFASPAVWRSVGAYCVRRGTRLPTLRRVFSAGAPVPVAVLEQMRQCLDPSSEMHTPYGATEALPVASISAAEVLGDTAEATRRGAGVCVGRKFPCIEWRVVRAVDGPLATIADAEELPTGKIGELIVRGAVVTREYVTRVESNALAKIADGPSVWHRMGDVGYVDDRGRFWYCGRLSHRVLTTEGPLYSEQCEAIFNNHPAVFRSALVGTGPAGNARPVVIVEPRPGSQPLTAAAERTLFAELRTLARQQPLTEPIASFLWHSSFPVDVRHNAKIFREKLAAWASDKLGTT